MQEINLSTLGNFEINLKLKNLAAEERRLTGTILQHIAEIDRRKLFLEMAYPSLFDYLTKEIGYSAGSAQRRIDAARLLQRVPEVLEEVASGAIHLGQISKLQQACRQVRKESHVSIQPARQKEILEKLKNKNNDQTDLILAQEFQIKIESVEKSHTQRDESVRIELTFSKGEMALIKEAQNLLSSKTGGSLKATIVEMAQKIVKASKAEPTATVAVKGELKSVTPRLKKLVRNRDRICQFRDAITGRQCGSTRFLEVDHIHPRFAGGENAPANLQILCKNHNLHRYRMGSRP